MRESWNDMLLDPGSVEFPLDLRVQFGRDAPLAVEIGFGSGRFLEWFSGERPGWNMLGVEMSPACHSRAYPRLRDGDRTNVKLFKGSGEFVVREVLPRASARRVSVQFPDPWPKDRHRDRRLLTAEFFEVLAGRLEQGGALRLTTDHDEYFEWALEQAASLGYYEVHPDTEPPFVDTRYGRKWKREGREFRHATFWRTGEPPWIPRTIEVVDDMHHATIEGRLPGEIEQFDAGARRLENGVVAVNDVYERLPDGELIVLVHIEEADLVQQLLVEVAPTGDGDEDRLTVRVRRFNQPLMTEGTAAAIDHVAEWVASLAEGNRIVGRQY